MSSDMISLFLILNVWNGFALQHDITSSRFDQLYVNYNEKCI